MARQRVRVKNEYPQNPIENNLRSTPEIPIRHHTRTSPASSAGRAYKMPSHPAPPRNLAPATRNPNPATRNPNPATRKNGRALVLKGKFAKLNINADGDLLFGECTGSGKNPYICSCDFIKPDAPTHRCSCPSRQFPCKHCLGLMYACAQGKSFSVATPPEALTGKREKLQERRVKKKRTAASRRLQWLRF